MSSTNTKRRSGRRIVTVWLSWAGVDHLDEIAKAEGSDRSQVIRTLLAEAIQARQARRS